MLSTYDHHKQEVTAQQPGCKNQQCASSAPMAPRRSAAMRRYLSLPCTRPLDISNNPLDPSTQSPTLLHTLCSTCVALPSFHLYFVLSIRPSISLHPIYSSPLPVLSGPQPLSFLLSPQIMHSWPPVSVTATSPCSCTVRRAACNVHAGCCIECGLSVAREAGRSSSAMVARWEGLLGVGRGFRAVCVGRAKEGGG